MSINVNSRGFLLFAQKNAAHCIGGQNKTDNDSRNCARIVRD